ncbi:unnamed protein product [Miscanthus lutarioriparius]|uniref:Gnk2-homologous domain-containing protein n=1 Tax=Miscanthus lutarioriparius TaxID=422564 RepID=A0A811SIE4_9POAL|nr:unnamed protein product [Miscanthus lutarioriparius]
MAWFSAAVTGILSALVDRAVVASNSTRKYFATAEMDFDPKIYGLAQCTPDLTPGQCRGCLERLLVTTTNEFLISRRPPVNNALLVWCQLRYSVSLVYEGQAMLQLPAPPEPPTQGTLAPPMSESGAGTKRSRAGIISVAVACSILLVLILSAFFLVRHR